MSNRITRFLPYFIIAALALPLLAHVYLGQYNRAMADDFCFTERAQEYGIFGAVSWWYQNWSAYYSAIVGQGTVGVMRAWQFIPAMLIILWVIAAIWTMYQFAVFIGLKRRWLTAGLLGLVLVFGVIDGTANVFQSFYWTSGAMTYTAPMIVLTANLGLILYLLRKQRVNPPSIALVAGLSIMSAGFSPLFGVFQLVLFAVAVAAGYFLAPQQLKRTIVILCGTGVWFTIIPLLIMLLAPGNAIRRAQLAPPMAVGQLLWFTPYATLGFLATSAGYLSPLALLLPLLAGVVVGFSYHPLEPIQRVRAFRNRYRLLGVIVLSGIFPITSVFFVGAFVLSDLPPASAYPIPQAAYVGMMIGIGYSIGLALQKDYMGSSNRILHHLAYGLILFMVVFGPVRSSLNTLSFIAPFRVFAAEWDNRDSQLTAASENGDKRAVLPPFSENLLTYADLKPNAGGNICIADFYGLEAVES